MSLDLKEFEAQALRLPAHERASLAERLLASINSEHLIDAIGLSPNQAMELHLRLKSFENDWDAPGMEEYDAL